MNLDENLYLKYKEGFKKNLGSVFLKDYDGRTVSYQDLDYESGKLANGLAKIGLSRGDRVSIQVDKCIEFIYLYLACLRSNIIFHPLNPAYTKKELGYFLEDAKPSLFIADEKRIAELGNLNLKHKIDHLLTLSREGRGSFSTIISNKKEFDTVKSSKDDIAALLYSSGTTGKPKGIMLSHENLSTNAKSLVKAWDFQPEDCLLHALPIYHVHGLFVALGCVLMSGSNLNWLDSFDVNQVIKLIPDCTVLMGVPTYYTRLVKHESLTEELTKNMRLFICGSAPLLEDTFHEFKKKTNHTILERYGMTETNMNTSNPLIGKRKPGSVGLPLENIEIKIVDDKNNIVPRGKIGNIQVKGPNVFKGYWEMPLKTKEDFSTDGYFNTGDKGLKDEEGYLSIIGRTKDLIISGGMNIYPKEIELIIDKLEGVKESAVIGVHDGDYGEKVIAIVVMQTNSEFNEIEIKKNLKENLAGYKCPKNIYEIEELPRNAMSKIQKNKLREIYSN